MPFDTAVKTAMFVRCNRLCCLCLKQCGLNVEAAHIVDESAGGSNEADNGIPLCFDCHQEVGSYNDRHPRGNKFRHEELRARRDRVYEWVAGGMLAGVVRGSKLCDYLPNPLQRIIDLLVSYQLAFGRVHQASSNEERLASLDEWRSCHPAVWEVSSVRDDTVRRLADPAKEWLSRNECRHVHAEDFNLVEEGAHVLSGFAVSPSPMATPDVYSKAYQTEDELWQLWKSQSDRYLALSGLIARLKELAARAGQRWTPSTETRAEA